MNLPVVTKFLNHLHLITFLPHIRKVTGQYKWIKYCTCSQTPACYQCVVQGRNVLCHYTAWLHFSSWPIQPQHCFEPLCLMGWKPIPTTPKLPEYPFMTHMAGDRIVILCTPWTQATHMQIYHLFIIHDVKVTFQWTLGVPWNEVADKLSKKGVAPQQILLSATLQTCLNILRSNCRQERLPPR